LSRIILFLCYKEISPSSQKYHSVRLDPEEQSLSLIKVWN
jgi:hypothetical protein